MSQPIIITSPATQISTRKRDDGTIKVSFDSDAGAIEFVLSRSQALALGARLVDDAALSILHTIQDAKHPSADREQILKTLNRV